MDISELALRLPFAHSAADRGLLVLYRFDLQAVSTKEELERMFWIDSEERSTAGRGLRRKEIAFTL